MEFQFHVFDVSFNNSIFAQIIVYPKNKWQLKLKGQQDLVLRLKEYAPVLQTWFVI